MAEVLPLARRQVLVLDCLSHGRFGNQPLHLLIKLWLLVVVGLLQGGALGRVHAEHVVVLDAVHLDREDRRLVRQRLVAHLADPWAEVEVLDGRHCTLELIVPEHIVVLLGRVHAEKHCLRGEDLFVRPHRLDEDLRDVVQVVEELIVLIFDVAVAQLVADQELLPDTERRELARHLRRGLVVGSLRQVEHLRRVVRAGRTDLIDVLHVIAGGRLRGRRHNERSYGKHSYPRTLR